ncbi:MAG TPA: hypothetical protein VNJ08_00725 [Bacteriovoracaceae bacterium]|nr:hypothetical protein [Bacteriovoracaceae bacterium]
MGVKLTKLIKKGQKENEVQKIMGNPIVRHKLDSKDYLFYRMGYGVLTDGLLTEVENYKFEYDLDGSLFSSYSPIGSTYADVFKQHAYPLEYIDKGQKKYFRFKKGALFFANGVVYGAVDQRFKQNIVYVVKLRSVSNGTAKPNAAYYVAPGSPNINPHDLFFRELKAYIGERLRHMGMKVVTQEKNADYIILTHFGITEQNIDIEDASRPAFSSEYTPGKLAGESRPPSQWSSGYVGPTTKDPQATFFNRWLNIEAVDYHHWKKTNELIPVWKILTNSVGPSSDIRLVLPALTLGVLEHTNKNSGKELTLMANPETLNKYFYETMFYSTPLPTP